MAPRARGARGVAGRGAGGNGAQQTKGGIRRTERSWRSGCPRSAPTAGGAQAGKQASKAEKKAAKQVAARPGPKRAAPARRVFLVASRRPVVLLSCAVLCASGRQREGAELLVVQLEVQLARRLLVYRPPDRGHVHDARHPLLQRSVISELYAGTGDKRLDSSMKLQAKLESELRSTMSPRTQGSARPIVNKSGPGMRNFARWW